MSCASRVGLTTLANLPARVAIRSDLILNFLRANGIEPKFEKSESLRSASEIAERARENTVQI
jgi:hypothetical protein